MHPSVKNLTYIQDKIKEVVNSVPTIIAVSKTFGINEILPLLDFGHKHFGENKVQEAVDKWSSIKKKFGSIQLHMIGKLQRNKVKFVIPLFDYIHSLDNLKLAEKISLEQKKQNKNLKIFIQINLGNEKQKNGINPEDLKDFYKKCVNDLNLNIIGLMCIPPRDKEAKIYFDQMSKLNKILKLDELSMGMSSDYLDAIKYQSTYIRVGSQIFGSRLK